MLHTTYIIISIYGYIIPIITSIYLYIGYWKEIIPIMCLQLYVLNYICNTSIVPNPLISIYKYIFIPMFIILHLYVFVYFCIMNFNLRHIKFTYILFIYTFISCYWGVCANFILHIPVFAVGAPELFRNCWKPHEVTAAVWIFPAVPASPSPLPAPSWALPHFESLFFTCQVKRVPVLPPARGSCCSFSLHVPSPCACSPCGSTARRRKITFHLFYFKAAAFTLYWLLFQ